MRLFNVKIQRSYATPAAVDAAVAKHHLDHLRYVVGVDGAGRYIPVFIGADALHAGVMHLGFCVTN